jgi:predicted transcriptional regulator
MEMYFSIWTFIMFTVTIAVTMFGFAFMQRSMNHVLREMAQQRERQEQLWQQQRVRQEEAWNRLLVKADNTERLTQEILARLAPRDLVH